MTAEPDPLGFGFIDLKYRQVYRGLPVWAGELALNWNRQHRLYLVSGQCVPTLSERIRCRFLSPLGVASRRKLTVDARTVSVLEDIWGRR